MRWPWQKLLEKPAPAVPERVTGPSAPASGWAFLPPLQRTVSPQQSITAAPEFSAGLGTVNSPGFLGTMQRSLDESAPGGLFDADGAGLAAPSMWSGAAEQPLRRQKTAPAQPADPVRHSAWSAERPIPDSGSLTTAALRAAARELPSLPLDHAAPGPSAAGAGPAVRVLGQPETGLPLQRTARSGQAAARPEESSADPAQQAASAKTRGATFIPIPQAGFVPAGPAARASGAGPAADDPAAATPVQRAGSAPEALPAAAARPLAGRKLGLGAALRAPSAAPIPLQRAAEPGQPAAADQPFVADQLSAPDQLSAAAAGPGTAIPLTAPGAAIAPGAPEALAQRMAAGASLVRDSGSPASAQVQAGAELQPPASMPLAPAVGAGQASRPEPVQRSRESGDDAGFGPAANDAAPEPQDLPEPPEAERAEPAARVFVLPPDPALSPDLPAPLLDRGGPGGTKPPSNRTPQLQRHTAGAAERGGAGSEPDAPGQTGQGATRERADGQGSNGQGLGGLGHSGPSRAGPGRGPSGNATPAASFMGLPAPERILQRSIASGRAVGSPAWPEAAETASSAVGVPEGSGPGSLRPGGRAADRDPATATGSLRVVQRSSTSARAGGHAALPAEHLPVAHPPAGQPTSAEGDLVAVESPVIQRSVESTGGQAGAVPGAGPGKAPDAVGSTAPPEDIEALAGRLFSPLMRRMKAELLLDRERHGRRIDRI
ncbi:MAG: hypothetical protein IIZ13_07715 [Renibacterium sp.]|nr:hypothetical protein [Renibacterium sp.]